MAENSKIEWTDNTFNPWIGCTKVSPACDNCYAEAWDKRYGGGNHWGPHANRRLTGEKNWNQPRRWNAQAEASGQRLRVFCASLADVFDNTVPTEWRRDLWKLIHDTPHLDWLLLTKRPQNIPKMLPDAPNVAAWGNGWKNVWLGTTVENQKAADLNIPALLRVPAVVRFLSCEPLLGPVQLTNIDAGKAGHSGMYWVNALSGDHDDMARPCAPVGKIHWVIAGGESGPGCRAASPEWFRSLRDQCAEAGVPFLFKQWGDWHADAYGTRDAMTGEAPAPSMRIGKRKAGRLLDGSDWTQFPRAA